MSEIMVDTEELADGLCEGVSHTNTIFASAPRKEKLRFIACGLTSAAIHSHLKEKGIPAQLMISSLDLEFDPDKKHVVPVAGEIEDDPRVIDAAYSQFLGYIGVSSVLERHLGQNFFPDREILDFKFSETDMVVDWLADVAIGFRENHGHRRAQNKRQFGYVPLLTASRDQIVNTYKQVWDLENYQNWLPPEHVREDGKVVGQYIPENAITEIK